MSGTVGTGFGAFQQRSRITRMPDNPMDRCTIVSVYPKQIKVYKPTLQPGKWIIPKAPIDGFSLLVVGPSSWYREVNESEPFLEIPSSSFVMVESILNDYMNGLPECNLTDRKPGLFFIPGEYDHLTINSYKDSQGRSFSELLKIAHERQNNWFKALVLQADVLWARSSGNPLTISDDARMAATMLKTDKAWLTDQKIYEMNNCPACGAMVNMAYPVCSNCKAVINSARAKELKLDFVK